MKFLKQLWENRQFIAGTTGLADGIRPDDLEVLFTTRAVDHLPLGTKIHSLFFIFDVDERHTVRGLADDHNPFSRLQFFEVRFFRKNFRGRTSFGWRVGMCVARKGKHGEDSG